MSDEQTIEGGAAGQADSGSPAANGANAGGSAVRQSIADRQNGRRTADGATAGRAGEPGGSEGRAAAASGAAPGAAPAGGDRPSAPDEGDAGAGDLGLEIGPDREDGGDPAIGPAGAAPQWRAFYRAIREAVTDMRSGK
ncbi:hypothetical protein [Paenibacillus glycinis]|uniref:Uncharacterized protein n=1 Tax=Paenibacillus glycinis TaxID=2697035 RepID=A0ABW9XXA9_9BACL|nr:hypothetical protein [Paenibacillus glycinis]NBD27343.1 hypothetical protein [Paenibacillus glycinis]